MILDKSEIRVLLKYEFHLGSKSTQTVRNINKVYGSEVVSQPTVSRWFSKFRSGDFDLTNAPRGRPETKVDNKLLKEFVEANPNHTVRELSFVFKVDKKTILRHMAEIGKVRKVEK